MSLSIPEKVQVKVPASTANLGPGYDVFGLAFQFYNQLEVQIENSQKESHQNLQLEIEGEGSTSLPLNEQNIIWKCMRMVFQKQKFPFKKYNFKVQCMNRIPLARGLGSSAAAQLSGILAGNAICGQPLNQNQVLNLAVEMEGHPDNVVPQLLGGLCISGMVGKSAQFLKFKMPSQLVAVVCVPEFELSTKKARAVLPKHILHQDAVFNVSRASWLLGSLLKRDFGNLKHAMQDRLHQVYRKKLVPGYDIVEYNAYQKGAWGVALSGAGPSMLALSSLQNANSVGVAMENGFKKAGYSSKSLMLKFDQKGAVVQVYN